MKQRRILLAVGAVLALTALLLAAWAVSPDGFAAYRDIVLGEPKYFVATGPPTAGPTDIPVLSQLAANEIEPVLTGCISTPEHEAYNAVIARHYHLDDPHAR